MTGFTDRQAKAWEEQVAPTLEAHGVPSRAPGVFGHWVVDWIEEVRPGRGQDFNGLYCDGDRFVQVMIDVYGRASVSIANLDWIHADSSEDLRCEDCDRWICQATEEKHFMKSTGRDFAGHMTWMCQEEGCEHDEVFDLWKKAS